MEASDAWLQSILHLLVLPIRPKLITQTVTALSGLYTAAFYAKGRNI